LNGGLVKLDSNFTTTYNKTHGLSAQTVFAIDEDKDGNIWLGTNGGGVCKFNGEEFDHYTADQGMSDGIVRAIKIDNDGNLWVGTLSQGICKITAPSSPEESTITYITKNEGLSSNQVYSFQIDRKGMLWIGTDSGLDMIDPTKEIIPNQDNFIHYNTKNGLTNNNALSMTLDNTGDLWVSTKKGINRLRVSQQKENEPLRIQQFGKYDGLISTDSYINSSYVDSKNRLWSGTGKSLLMLEIDKLPEAKNAPIPELSYLEIDQQFYNFRHLPDSAENIGFDSVASFANYPVNLELPYYRNHLTFYFTAPDWSAPHNVEYSYMMEPINADWSQVSSKNLADYRNLNYGEYNFMLRARGNSKKWSPTYSYKFTIHPPWWHTWWARTLYGLGVILLFVLIYRWRTQKMRQRQEELEQEVELATEEIRTQKEAVENQKEMIEEAHKEITDSIAYAKRIQHAILPPPNIVKEYLKNSFVLYLPKDIVAGDFYWMQKKNDMVLFAAADCTGHGVPGAMVSVVCNNALNRSVREYNLSDPGKILDSAREIVIQEFANEEGQNNSGESWEVKDGMDIALCSIKGMELKYAGAHNPLWIIRNGEVIETKANKQPIGLFIQPVPFDTHTFQLEKKDSIYIFSDGLVDQFGGEKGKKFKAKAFKELLLSIQEKSMDEQKTIIHNAFLEWMGSLEQIDDVCVIGVRV
jgi:serine phosphatase RsbU (regulator of sigma subunit)/sugar lactone lactonase YvrE